MNRTNLWSVVVTATVALVVTCVSAAAQDPLRRKWNDSTGRFSVVATLVAVQGQRAMLRKDDGSVVVLPLKRFGRGDRQIISKWLTSSSTPKSGGAKVALRLKTIPQIFDQYEKNPDGYPVCRDQLDLVYLGGDPPPPSADLFKTRQAIIEDGSYSKKSPGYKGDDIVRSITAYEDNGWDVWGVFVYREEWLKTKRDDPGEAGPYPVDRRILSLEELTRIRSAIAQSDLKCRDTVRIIQLLGGRVQGQSGASWLKMGDDVRRHLLHFDGVGTECHIGDYRATENFPDGPATLTAMAAMAKWAAANDKAALVFMGGLPHTYENFAQSKRTYDYLWSEMDKIGVNKNASNLIYFRQGAREGNHVPETDPKTLTYQTRWLINQLK